MFQGAIQRQSESALFLHICETATTLKQQDTGATLPMVILYCGQSYKRKGDATEVRRDLGALPDAALSLSAASQRPEQCVWNSACCDSCIGERWEVDGDEYR